MLFTLFLQSGAGEYYCRMTSFSLTLNDGDGVDDDLINPIIHRLPSQLVCPLSLPVFLTVLRRGSFPFTAPIDASDTAFSNISRHTHAQYQSKGKKAMLC